MEGVSDPAGSAALEEFCVRHLPADLDLLIAYVNAPAVVVGRHQAPPAEADLSYLARKQIRLVRRLSGGGAVFHDPGNLNFAFVSAYRRDRFLRYDRFLAPVIEALQEIGAPVRFQEPNAIALSGRKVSGNAQFTDLRRMLTHGTLLFSADLDVLKKALTPRAEMVESRGVASAPSPVTNLNRFLRPLSDMAAFRRRLLAALEKRLGDFELLKLAESDRRRINRLHLKYRSWQWTWGRTPRFTVDQSLPGPGGVLRRLRLQVEGGIIREVLRPEGLSASASDAGILLKSYDEVIGFPRNGESPHPGVIES